MVDVGLPGYMRLLSTNAASKEIRANPRLLIYGECVRVEHPEILRDLSKGRTCLAACPESEHINIIALKVASIVSRLELEELLVLTVDGSPHCIQLHHAVEEALKIARSPVEVKHLVIYKGKASEISKEAIKTARYLFKIENLIKTRTS